MVNFERMKKPTREYNELRGERMKSKNSKKAERKEERRFKQLQLSLSIDE